MHYDKKNIPHILKHQYNLWYSDYETDRRTEKQIEDRQIDRYTERYMYILLAYRFFSNKYQASNKRRSFGYQHWNKRVPSNKRRTFKYGAY